MLTRPSRVVKTQIGDVQGKTFDFGNGRVASSYLGIPYAQPPIGDLRFKKPLPAKKWTGVRKCTEFATHCYYRNPTHQLRPSEDCLFLNVFVPEKETLTDLPVLFYIHGGGFMLDSSSTLGCENICKYLCAAKDVIVVTINYRLGIFGFLSLDPTEVPGNYGLWDMTLALQWVHDNIEAFGGSNKRITCFGQSAGSVAVDYLSLSPHSRDLFQQAMMFAGTSHCDFISFDWDEYGREFALEHAKFHGFVDKPEYSVDERNAALLAFYRRAKARDLALGIMPAPGFRFRSAHLIPYDADFFPKPLDELRKRSSKKKTLSLELQSMNLAVGSLESNHHPWIQSVAVFFMKSLLNPSSFVGRHLFKRIMSKKSLKTKPAHETYRPIIKKLFCQMRPDLESSKVDEILDQFLDSTLSDDEYVKKAIEIISDLMFVFGTWKTATERATLGDRVYFYKFHYYKPGSVGLMSVLLPFESATHCCEIPFIFGVSILGHFTPDQKDEEMIEKFTTYLTSFAKTGNPNNEQFADKVWEPLIGKSTVIALGTSIALAVGCLRKKDAGAKNLSGNAPRPVGVSMVSEPPAGPPVQPIPVQLPATGAQVVVQSVEKRTEEVEKKSVDGKVVKEEVKEQMKVVVEEKDGAKGNASQLPEAAPKVEDKKEESKPAVVDGKEKSKKSKKEVAEGAKAEAKENKTAIEKEKPELKPREIKLDAKAQKIHEGKEKRGKGDYPTMDDVVSDWDSKKEGADQPPTTSKNPAAAAKKNKGNTKDMTNLDDPEAEGGEKKA
ncbi:Carboxylic ester hydrolase [Aphelenchoides besseyi]|nr:Carboxylic ester hydrolase [Aphelenchoides besseyi]